MGLMMNGYLGQSIGSRRPVKYKSWKIITMLDSW